MGLSFSQPLWLLGLPAAAALLAAVMRRWPPPLSRRRANVALALRLVLVALLLFSLAGARVTSVPHQRVLVALVDLSASDRSAADQETQAVRRLAAARGPDDLFAVVTFGRTAEVEVPPTRNPVFDTFETQPDPDYTDIAGALQLAAGVAPAGYARQIVLVTDGRQNLGDAAVQVQALQTQGVRVDVLPSGRRPVAEEMVLGVTAPAEARAGQVVSVTVQLSSNIQAAGHLLVSLDGAAIADQPLALAPGLTAPSFTLPALGVGLHRVRAELVSSPDTYPENNVGEAAIRVVGRPAVLLLEGAPGEAQNVAAALRAGGVETSVQPVESAPVDPAKLEQFQSAVLVDTPAAAFPAGAMQALAASVRDLGHGLVAIGGPNSYGPGGWEGTPLDDAMPVSSQIPPRKERPKVAVVLVLESMESPTGDQIALTAAESVIRSLRPEDEVAVTDGARGLVVPMTQLTDVSSVIAKLEAAQLGDSPDYGPYLQQAGQSLLATDAPLKHIVVLGDGDAQDTENQAVLTGLHAQGITTSAIYIPDQRNFPPAATEMQDIALWGGGRFYSGLNASDVPQLLLQESKVALKPWFEQFAFFPRLSGSGDLLAGVPTDAFPQLQGYVVTTPKPAAEVYLSSPKTDPILAGWQYGLGRSVAWTSDAEGRWTGAFLRSAVAADLFAHIVDWTIPAAGSGTLQASAAVSGTSLNVDVSGPPGATGTLEVTMVSPDLTTTSTVLTQLGPGHWNGSVPAGVEGTYALHLALRRAGVVVGQGELAAVVPYSAEFRTLGPDTGLLRLLARLGGGSVLGRVEQAWGLPIEALPVGSLIFWPLLLVAVVVWPLDVALRRLALGPRQLAALAAELVRFRRPSAVEVALPAELVRLTERVGAFRRPRAASSAPSENLDTTPQAVAQEPVAPGEPESEQPLAERLLKSREGRPGSS